MPKGLIHDRILSQMELNSPQESHLTHLILLCQTGYPKAQRYSYRRQQITKAFDSSLESLSTPSKYHHIF